MFQADWHDVSIDGIELVMVNVDDEWMIEYERLNDDDKSPENKTPKWW